MLKKTEFRNLLIVISGFFGIEFFFAQPGLVLTSMVWLILSLLPLRTKMLLYRRQLAYSNYLKSFFLFSFLHWSFMQWTSSYFRGLVSNLKDFMKP